MRPFKGQTENAGHFLQPATKAIGHKVITLLLYWHFVRRNWRKWGRLTTAVAFRFSGFDSASLWQHNRGGHFANHRTSGSQAILELLCAIGRRPSYVELACAERYGNCRRYLGFGENHLGLATCHGLAFISCCRAIASARRTSARAWNIRMSALA